ncbi:hypothetical protein F5B22DRAFT_626696 [Xylaria bambusicola]|uniref:uncharacterized protein n=1 Tax=Xylaria bambusicola TaxID=326684 RepID=UPI00200788FC|nr:uncharacterized protein F5B22DRAFT_626696 [Xylaria bambusicola]KAI0505758.1 hypothetical protein F5B22DRAFT_626696 [Xylaria bambusicola]
MSYSNQQPPPLPPRSPRPPVTGFAPSPQHPGPSFPPPPRRLPSGHSGYVSSPVGPPPPLPPRPAGYEIRTPSNPSTPLTYSPSAGHAPPSPHSQAGPPFPLPPPPPYSAFPVDASTPQHALHPGPVPGATSPSVLTTFPPPPPGPPPQPSPHPSPGIPQYSPAPSRPLSAAGPAAGYPSSQSPIQPAQHHNITPDSGQTPSNDFHVPPSNNFHTPSSNDFYTPPSNGFHISTSSDENPPIYQSSSSNAGSSHGASVLYPQEKASRNEYANPISSEAPSTESSNSTAESSGVIPSVAPSQIPQSTQEPLEASFQSLHLNSGPPVPPKAPLAPSSAENQLGGQAASSSATFSGYRPYVPPAPSSTQNQPGEQAASSSATFSGYRPYVYSPQTNPPQDYSAKPAPSPPNAQPKPYSPPPLALPKPKAVASCIDTLVTFTTDWYYHPEASKYLICSRCYVDHIHGTKFQDTFHRSRFDDGKPRLCRFNKPRMKDHIFKEALASGFLRKAVEWMQKRSSIVDCKGVEGVKGKSADGIVWYMARDLPGFLSCEACYEDMVLTNQFAHNLSVHTDSQGADDVWSCDIAVPFIEREYEQKAKQNDWEGFVAEAQARLTGRPCPGSASIRGYGRKWFVPRAGPQDLILCFACYCDQVIGTGEDSKWEAAPDFPIGADVRCARGRFNCRILMAKAAETKDYAMFWDTVHRLYAEKPCEGDGIVDGVWYTLASNPKEFGVCGACCVGILEPLDIARFWKRRTDVPPGAKLLCCFNFNHPRFKNFIPGLLEMWYTKNPRPLDEYASVYASIAPCMRDEDKPNLRWYGWGDCTICPECYQDFARDSPLDKLMEYRNTEIAGNTVCEMYSTRMRNLYTECGNASPPKLQNLLEFSAQRRQVYIETVPQIRHLLAEANRALEQQKMLNVLSSHHNFMGSINQINYGTTHGAPGVGYGYANRDLLQGAQYGQQATAVMMGILNGGYNNTVQQLEQRWRAVE